MRKIYLSGNIIRLAPLFALGLLFGACNQPSDSASNAGSMSITVSPAAPTVATPTTITLQNADQAVSYSWKITDSSGLVLSSCAGTSSPITCTFSIGGTYTITVTGTNHNQQNFTATTSISIIDPASAGSQPPIIIADVYDTTPALQATFSTNTALDSGSLNVAKGTYTLKLDRTTDAQDPLSALKFAVSINSGAFSTVATDSPLLFSSATVYSIQVRATDTEGNVSTISFSAYIKCDPGQTTPLVVTGSDISVSAGANRNVFSYSASGVTGGTGPYKYQWDFNGDGIYDTDWATATTATGTYTPYTLYEGTRNVGLAVWDTGCNQFASATTAYNFVIPEGSTMGGSLTNLFDTNYYYIQGDIAPLAGNNDTALSALQNATIVASQNKAAPTTPQHVPCNYYKVPDTSRTAPGSSIAAFTIGGYNDYTRSLSPTNHGISLTVTGLSDTVGLVPAVNAVFDTSSAVIATAFYVTDGAPDEQASITYSKHAACTLQMLVTPKTAASPCDPTTPSMNAYAVIVEGTYSCPDLVDQSGLGLHVSMGTSIGAFYCEVSNVNACIGGGHTTPGIPPTPE